MIINSTILKEKNIKINQFVLAPKMQIKIDRTNLMPESPIQNNSQCELQMNVSILDEEKKELVVIKLVYVVIFTLEKDDCNYSQQEYADKIFHVLKSMFILSSNELLRETSFPPLPLDLKC